MELTTRGRYAVMAMADLARAGNGGAVPLPAIAERQQLSLDYLEQIFLRLRRAGLVVSARGRQGGFALARPADSITIADIMAAIEERTRITRCGDGSAGCLGTRRCPAHELWQALGDHIAAFLASVTLQEVLDGIPPEKRAVRTLRSGREAAA